MDVKTDIKNCLITAGIDCAEIEHAKFGYDLRVNLVQENVRRFASIMLENGFYLVHVAGLHLTPAMQVIYELADIDSGFRVNALVESSGEGTVPTISDIYHGASWHERETRDFFGIVFEGNADMRPLLLMDTDTDFHPLLKEGKTLKSLESVTWMPEPEKTAPEKPAS